MPDLRRVWVPVRRRWSAAGVTMDEVLARSLDVSGLRAVLPPLEGDGDLVAVAEVLRCGVIANLVSLVAAGASSPASTEDKLRAAYREWIAPVFRAPVDAGWWVEHCPTSASEVAALVAVKEERG